MIKGAIDLLENGRVGGWIYSEAVDLEGQHVLAFVGRHCVGSGVVGIFRQDLFDAGLGNGRCGFSFDADVSEGGGDALVIRLEDSDLSLLQVNSKVSKL
ncbi:hypothetical protein [Sphingomonas faeni]|uniref:hypothetical protein n=1 Tax=Sphingomonas faeni TaxID=185950 RepID=UPI003360F797